MKRACMLGLRLALLFVAMSAHAHKSSDAYLQVDSTERGTTVRWDIALRDLDAALDLDSNDDGVLTWGEVKAAWPRIEAYSMARFTIAGCTLTITGRGLERRNDGAYAVLQLASACTLAQPPSITYTLFREIDPTHRGIMKVQLAGQTLALSLLDPTRAAAAAPVVGGARTPVQGIEATESIAPTGTWGFLREGIHHILTGYDHVLFLLCLLLPSVMRRTPQGWRPVGQLADAVWPVVGIVSAFTLAHSITLGLAAMKLVSLAPAVIEPAIAVTIVLAALDNLWPIFPARRVVVTFCFGLVHGFGFAGVLSELNLPAADFAWALLQFNVGLEIGQLMIVIGATSLLFSLRDKAHYRSWVIRGGSFAAMLIGVLWLIERTANVAILTI